ncbi:serine/threonine protein kinase [Limnohabitans planktonicus]|uniref:Stress response kinase A n=1 Tax=Limnohabitans planktonicus II-D5 TaxID=1293045 RepID=A0A2T7UE93_9BURK|nr:serine/threonine protein kinase [Limnohabitans planktonicus]PVE43016.1 stress response kinase A [Limnohabitans planktonicus II-D5]|eukprot:gene1686-1653_t
MTHTNDARHPYSELTPDRVMDALQDLGLWPDGRLLALSSYENRVYRAHLDEPVQGHAAVVLKFYRPGRWSRAQIQEEHDFAAELVAGEVPVVAPLVLNGQTLHQSAGFDFSVSPLRGGRAPELDDFEVLEWIGRFLARIHTVGAAKPFVHRPTLDVQTFALEPAEWLQTHQMIPLEVEREWREAFAAALALVQEIMAEGSSERRLIRLHGDCHPGNILWTPTELPGGGPHFVDLDDARMGPAVQDLWMLLSGDRAQRTQQLSALLDGYEQVRDFDRAELRLIEPLRTLRLIHYSAWLARRWEDPIFPVNFPWFGTPDYWRGQVLTLQEQIERMQQAPLVV